MATIIDGKALATAIRGEIKEEIGRLRSKTGLSPGLGAILDPDYPPSRIYVGMKEKGCQEVGILSKIVPVKKDRRAILEAVAAFNADAEIDGILVQLPLPAGIDADEIIAAVDPGKDADGLHPYNMGKLLLGRPSVEPCTPAGIIRLLDHAGVAIAGSRAVVVGRSNIVGKPVAQLLLNRDATVTLCHSKTRDLGTIIGQADIVVAAVGKPGAILGAWIGEGAAVIDVGVNRLADGRLVGDVEFDAATRNAAYITPVPGGVGPMTVAMLLSNTLKLAKRRRRWS